MSDVINYGWPAGTTVPALTNTGATRLDVLKNELASGLYSQTLNAGIQREIDSITSGKSGDMNASSSASAASVTSSLSSWSDSLRAQMRSTVSGWLGGVSDNLSGVVGDAVTGAATSATDSAVKSVKTFFADSATTIAMVVIGVILLIGAFLIYRK